jgi:hypothetical protein
LFSARFPTLALPRSGSKGASQPDVSSSSAPNGTLNLKELFSYANILKILKLQSHKFVIKNYCY